MDYEDKDFVIKIICNPPLNFVRKLLQVQSHLLFVRRLNNIVLRNISFYTPYLKRQISSTDHK